MMADRICNKVTIWLEAQGRNGVWKERNLFASQLWARCIFSALVKDDASCWAYVASVIGGWVNIEL
jgi:hypothetical protein